MATNLPPGLVIEPMTGKIWGWMDPGAAGSYLTTVAVDDLNGGVSTVQFPWDVTVKQHAPHATRIPDIYTPSGSVAIQNILSGRDVDGDTLTFSATGLPPGLTYDPAANQLTGTATAPGYYQVTVTADDGHGGTDSMSFQLGVATTNDGPHASLHGALPPETSTYRQAHVLLLESGSLEPRTIIFTHQGDPNAVSHVTLEATPAGRIALSQTSFDMKVGDWAWFSVTPLAVSQKLGDIELKVYVDGVYSDQLSYTVVGVVQPQDHIKGPDTPNGMDDRVSVGDGTWGTYYGEMQVYPNLMGFHFLNLSIQTPDNDPRYGLAEALDSELVVANHSVEAVS